MKLQMCMSCVACFCYRISALLLPLPFLFSTAGCVQEAKENFGLSSCIQTQILGVHSEDSS